ncbi:membrane protein involved in the export of O-antigen and teichoic acid [Gloeobacter kilaueensis]|uniref:Membrane protein involved in the export of O-antigen and teichoic acid n=1 Tax=Gloeobacter kilaueensis (strain ATCC BAA-2537 / CCAP 1431/1 / ULC 316 / JS1) TaxID=1183438 RepID=U5QG69_GLOK1|nr:membrane protein involved in the export of O-antigen and teichoic acid [Gloeobacter kilaueensis]AGY57853.1 membrane protein involved in the export of O-antigen and teichoic acid [Gloeobacter kilaueensis JS1]
MSSINLSALHKYLAFPLRLWNSPTFTTWSSLAARTLSLIAVFPLVLRQFTPADIVVWSLLSSIISLQTFVDLGFAPTFARVVAFAMGGAKNIRDLRDTGNLTGSGQANWSLMEQICSTMQVIYYRLTLISICVLAILGSLALAKPISLTSDSYQAWAAWVVVLLGSTVALWGNRYNALLQGMNQIALLQRWQVITSLGAIFSGFLVLITGGKLLALVLSNQLWIVVGVLRDRWLCRQVEERRLSSFTYGKLYPEVFEGVWPSAWRSGLGAVFTAGLMQASNLVYAQLGATSGIASYLVALRLIQSVSQFSQAPFYSKLPLLARLRSQGKLVEQVAVATRGMRLAYWSFVVCFIGLGVFGPSLLQLIGSHAEFVNPVMWGLLGTCYFIERYGAMHLQLYSTTNHIVWHIVSVVHGLIFLSFSFILFPFIGVYAFPTALLAGYAGFYARYCARYSYKTFQLKFWQFELSTSLIPLAIILAYCVGATAIYLSTNSYSAL